MFTPFRYCTLAGILMMFAFSTAASAVETDIAKIQAICDKAIENRLKIKQWHVKLDCVNTGERRLPTALAFYVDSQRIREDKTFPGADGKPETSYRIQGDDFYYVYKKIDDKIDSTLSLYQVENKSRYAPKDAFLLDFRVFGFSSIDFGTGSDPLRGNFAQMAQNKRIEKIMMEDDVLNEILCKKISISIKNSDGRVTYWLAMNCGYAPIRAETENESSGYHASTDVEIGRYKNTDLWIPIRVVTEKSIDGKLDYKTEYTITVYSINEPLDPKLFSPESLGLPVGTPVDMHAEKPKHLPHLWDGKKTVTEGEMLTEQIIQGRAARFSRIRYLLMATGLAMICGVLLYKFFSYQKPGAIASVDDG